MLIIQNIADILLDIFPKIKESGNNIEVIIEELTKYYTYGGHKPTIVIEDGIVTIEIDSEKIKEEDAEYEKAVSLCEQQKFSEAKKILNKLIANNPTNSEYHRNYGQILSIEGNQDEAINYLIDALRWNPKNHWALVMMGNIFVKENDIETAMKYYDTALKADPENTIAINNIGGALLQQGKNDEAKKYFTEALKVNPAYPNAHYALGLISQQENDLHSAFFSATEALKRNTQRDTLYKNSIELALETAEAIIKTGIGKGIVKEYIEELSIRGNVPILVLADDSLPTAARLELAENHNRKNHLVKYLSNYPAIEHLQMHELVHLHFTLDAREVGLNQLFVTTQDHKKEFLKGLDTSIKFLKKKGISDEQITKYLSGLYDGLNRQIFNVPIDLFIEDFLYNEYVELRPYQFLSLFNMKTEAMQAMTNKNVIETSPKEILTVSKILNLIEAYHFKTLFGVDLIKDFKATPSEVKQAEAFYEEYKQYKDDKEPAEEFELIEHWAEDLKLDKNFELVSEEKYRKRNNLDEFIKSVEKDPFEVDTPDPKKERDMDKFLKQQAIIKFNPAVMMFMVDALEYFKDMPESKIKEIALQIAMQGTQGYGPDKKGYKIPAIPEKEFSGYNILAYYYVSWMLVLPDMVPQLKLPYEEEYTAALKFFKTGE